MKIYDKKTKDLLESFVTCLITASSMRDSYTGTHQKMVSKLAVAIAKEMHLSKETVYSIKLASMIHDIGKIYVPSEILTKPEKLGHEEFAIVKKHCCIGYEIIKNIKFNLPIASMILQHHERMDGSGYPSALRNGDIILGARIIGVADVVEAMTHHRPYRPSLGLTTALEEIEGNKGILYDEKVVNACVNLFLRFNFKFDVNGEV